MLWIVAAILVILWLIGFVRSFTMGGIIHILLVVDVMAVLVYRPGAENQKVGGTA